MIETMKKLAKEKDICVLATVSGDKPHCSLMAYTTDEDCSEIYMATHKSTQKFRNLMENSSVSLLIDTREEHKGSKRHEAKAMTVSGVFERLEDNQKNAWARARLLGASLRSLTIRMRRSFASKSVRSCCWMVSRTPTSRRSPNESSASNPRDQVQ
jgi:nitroimidazol reductase NimA-like FMN-containing flavoprotein (pyridoxamine 5'-phosphate oxidase superfamily)